MDVKASVLWGAFAMIAYLLQQLLYTTATIISHKSSFEIMKNIRDRIVDKISKCSMGTVAEKSQGEYKKLIVDDVEALELPLAHMIPELTSNLVAPILILIYLFIKDYRMALASLISFVIAGIVTKMMMGKEAMRIYQVFTKGSEEMNETVVEYIRGLQVIKAFNQTTSSMKRFKDASLRTIALAAGTSTGSIYTRFHNKVGLFHAIVDPVVDELRSW
ncbi:ABC transporter transmembrane domain-containing protein [Clostridium estertheticum]|uniref:ABC transporter transmembrane domain-containing protein n=1 Tax=Clostridium estertheticum TaxID=238834 RepID=UPI001C0B8466|nr:ABC transporter transmembrane domain-containing protein [Clostridium estertheticum]MBU3074765.1 TetR family transcriptional regulator [Clostridium estertheticum]MBU3164980.1 TetR family transcriptional regulator [Clostridium estertheticum]